MIESLPQRIEGETFESLVSRVGRRISPTGRIHRLGPITGESFAGRLSPAGMVGSLLNPEWLSLPQVLEEHTALPIFRPFLDPPACARFVQNLARARRILRVTQATSPRLRYCPTCRNTEFVQLAEAGWHLVHQLRWIWRCQTHQCPLWQINTRPDGAADAYLVDSGCRTRANVEDLKAIERDTKWLLGARVPPLGRLRWRAFHRAALTGKFGIQPPYASAKLFQIAHEIGPRPRQWLNLSMISHLDNWLFTVVRTPLGTTDPLLHLATLRVCGKRASDAVAEITKQQSVLRPDDGGYERTHAPCAEGDQPGHVTLF